MSIKASPTFVGKITVGSTNNTIQWEETDGSSNISLSVTVPSGDYWPTDDSGNDLETVLGTLMSTESSTSGFGGVYVFSVVASTGGLEVAVSGGTLTGFRFLNTSSYTNKFLTGGDVSVGERGRNHFGFAVDSSVGSFTTGVDSGHQIANTWYPSVTPRADDVVDTNNVVQLSTIGGKQTVYVFSEDMGPDDTNYNYKRIISFSFLTSSDKSTFLSEFWLPYGRKGEVFRYYDENTSSSYVLYVLTEDSLNKVEWGRIGGYSWWSASLTMRRYKS